MTAQELLAQISDYCRQTGLAESTFGRRAVNDGKLANRLRNGGRITTETVDRIHAFMNANSGAGPTARQMIAYHGGPAPALPPIPAGAAAIPTAAAVPVPRGPLAPNDPQRNFRFFDNRQKYLLFVNTCSEKWVVAHRVGQELTNIHPRPPSVRAVRCRRRRRHRAGTRDALDARPLPRHAVLRSSARKSAWRTSASLCRRWRTASSSTPRRCWC